MTLRPALSLATLSALALPLACSNASPPETTSSNVEELTSDGTPASFDDPTDDSFLAGEPDGNHDAIAGVDPLSDEDDHAVALAELDVADPPGETDVTLALHTTTCKKRITVTFAVYTYLTPALRSNGCWAAEHTVQDASFRDCHSDGSIKNPHGDKWFYDDTNPYNDHRSEVADVQRCARSTLFGYEYMAYRESRWRLVQAPDLHAFYAELYLDDDHIDSLWYARGVYRSNPGLARHRRVAPMLNFGVPLSRYSPHEIGVETLKICKRIRNRGYLGLYGSWHRPFDETEPSLLQVERALNLCTGH